MPVTDAQRGTNVSEIADGLFRVSTSDQMTKPQTTMMPRKLAIGLTTAKTFDSLGAMRSWK